jgi:hypothetical protein
MELCIHKMTMDGLLSFEVKWYVWVELLSEHVIRKIHTWDTPYEVMDVLISWLQ